MKALINSILAMITTTSTAFAANGDLADDTGILCWVFFGLCAVLVACQMVPAAMLGTGAARALTAKPVVASTQV